MNAATYYHVLKSTKRVQVHQGGSRAGKTYSILQALIELCHLNKGSGMTISVVRKTLPALKASALRDFIEILTSAGWYSENNHNKTEHTYTLFGNLVEFVSLDQPQKVRGRKRHVLFCNEANELTLEDFRQLSMRTTMKIILDYNPSMIEHWIYDEVIPREDCEYYQTTYKDNPHLEDVVVKEIERLQETDPDMWRIYGLGERGVNRHAVYWASPGTPKGKLLGYGLDFGFSNDPTALVSVHVDDKDLYVQEHLYMTGLTNSDLIAKLEELEIPKREYIIADSADPKSIEEIHRAGWLVKPAKKGTDSVRAGIQLLKQHKLFYEGDNLRKEFLSYKWKVDKNKKATNYPEDDYNHALDAARYVCLNLLKRGAGKYVVG